MPDSSRDQRFTQCLALVLQHEGGYSDHPDDPGGCTNLGVTIATLSDWVGRPCNKADVKCLKPKDVAPIYEARYWRAAGCDKLPPGVDYMVFDMAVNSGPKRAVKYLQEAVGVTPDGSFGPKTRAAVDAMPARDIIAAISRERAAFYRSLSTFRTFGKGWIRRLTEVTATALAHAK